MSYHLPLRPHWRCVACDANWPCHTRRRQLRAEFEGAYVSLALYLTSCLVDATVDLPERTGGLLYRQFLGWLRPPTTPIPPMPRRPLADNPPRIPIAADG